MTLDLSTYKVANAETSDANKFDNLLDAIQAAVVALQTAPSSPALATGDFVWAATRTRSGCLLCDGTPYARATYPALFSAIVPTIGVFTVTIASPGVFTLTGHGLVIGDRVYLTTNGALPTGLVVNTIYYVVSTPDANTFTLSATEGGAAINTSVSQSGVHTLTFCPYGLGDGSTTFNVPDASGRSLFAAAGASGHSSVRALGQSDLVAVANRAARHNSTVVQPTINITDPTHVHASVVNGGSGGGGGASQTVVAGNTSAASTGITATATGGTVGPGGTLPVDQPANLVGHLFIKT